MMRPFFAYYGSKWRAVGNSVCPPLAAAIVSANCADMAAHRGQQRLWGVG